MKLISFCLGDLIVILCKLFLVLVELFIIVVGQSLDSDSTCGALYHSIHKDSGGPGVGPHSQVKKLKERKK